MMHFHIKTNIRKGDDMKKLLQIRRKSKAEKATVVENDSAKGIQL